MEKKLFMLRFLMLQVNTSTVLILSVNLNMIKLNLT